MGTGEIIISFIGMLICCFVVAMVGVLIAGLLWWMLKKNIDFEDLEEWEESNE